MSLKNFSFLSFFLFLPFVTIQAQNSSLWFGYYQEDAGNNPEDPMMGMVYAYLPGNGLFSGEMVFSYAGCQGGMQRGRISGQVGPSSVTGNWTGTVDGRNVGGRFLGNTSANGHSYTGTYTNREGKKKIECQGLTYYVAARGNWTLQGSSEPSEMNVDITVDAREDHVYFEWTDFGDLDVYRFVVVDKVCLEQEQDLEKCMVWNGEYGFPDITYGEEFEGVSQAKPLQLGTSYIIYVSAYDGNGSIMDAIAKEFTYE